MMADLNYVSPLTSDLTDYYTKTEVDELQQGDAATYATTAQVDSKDNAVKNWVENKGYLTQHQSLANYATKTYVDDAIAEVEVPAGVSIEVVNALPSAQNARENVIYLVLSDDSNSGNIYNEWIYVPAAEDFEMIGNTAEGVIPDLTDYATKAWVGQQGYITSVDAKDVEYDNDASGLEAANVKNAIDEVNSKFDDYATAASLSTVATSGDYDDLINKPTIPSLTGYATQTYVNDAIAAISIPDVSNFITAQDLPDVSIYAETANLATVATSGDYDDLTNKPSIPDTTGMATQTWVQNQGYLTSHQDISGKANIADLATVATSGSYEDLSNKPTIPTVPTNVSDFTNDAGYITSADLPDLSGYAELSDIPDVSSFITSSDLPDVSDMATETWVGQQGYLTQHQDISGKANSADLATVATSGSYSDLSNKPDLSGYLTSSDLSGYVQSSSLATVATSGSYNDLSDKPTIPSGGVSEVFAPLLPAKCPGLTGICEIVSSSNNNNNDEAIVALLKKGKYVRMLYVSVDIWYGYLKTSSQTGVWTYTYSSSTHTWTPQSISSGNITFSNGNVYGLVAPGMLYIIPFTDLTTIYDDLLTYSNTTSGLSATTIQGAIDELAASAGGSVSWSFDDNTNTLTLTGVEDGNM